MVERFDLDKPLDPFDDFADESEASKGQHKKKDKEFLQSLFVESTWIIPYGNLMTLLMIFFMILYAYSTLGNSAQYEKAMAVIQKEMGGDDEQLKKIMRQEKEAELATQMEGFIKNKNLSEYAKVQTNAQRVKISLANPILFDSGSADLKAKALPALNEILTLIKTLPNPIIVEGHTDNVPISKGRYRSNFELSAARAFSVIKFFIEDKNVSPARLSAFGYGEYRPLFPNDTEQHRSMNRRIEISILRKYEEEDKTNKEPRNKTNR